MQKHLDIIRPLAAKQKRHSRKKQYIISGVIGVVLLVIALTTYFVQYQNSSQAKVESDKYQALFLVNNQVYFGKLHLLSDDTYQMTDVFYIQQPAVATTDPNQKPTSQDAADPTKQNSAAQPTLVKLGNEIHAPEDSIVFNNKQVLYWENIKNDGKVAKAIQQYKNKNN